jgi:hypothetical protein
MAWNMHHQTSFSNCLQLAVRYGVIMVVCMGGEVGAWAWARAEPFAMGIAGCQWQWQPPRHRRAAGVTNYHPPPVVAAATSRFENMARKQPRCAAGPPCGRRVPVQLHLGRFITHLPRCPLSWYTHPTYTLYRPPPVLSPGSVEQSFSKILLSWH